MNTRQVNSAAGVIMAALTQNRTAAGIALALESAGLLMSPEAAADMASVSTDAVALLDKSVGELKREHELSAELRRALDQSQEDVTGACLARWEEEQDNARLRLALKSAQRGRRELRAWVAELMAQRQADHETWQHDLRTARDEREATAARIAELEAERHSTNEALDDAVQALRADRAEPAKGPTPDESASRWTAFFAPVASLREDPHDSPLHHNWRLGRDLPEMGGAQ